MANPQDSGTFEIWITDTRSADIVAGRGGHTGGFETWVTSTTPFWWYVNRDWTLAASGGITPTGNMLKMPGTHWTGGIAPSGGIGGQVGLNLGGVIAPIGALIVLHLALLPTYFKGMYRRMFNRMR